MTSLTVVVPAYNEETTIGTCLDRLLDQTRPVDEIIVVDNASTDKTSAVVEPYVERHPSVRLIREETPGILAARRAGFDAATCDVIGRTDADTFVGPRWAESIVDVIDSRGDEFEGVTGPVFFWGGPAYERLKSMFLRGRLAEEGGEVPSMAGTNMAITAARWRRVRDRLIQRDDIWEDMDLSFTLADDGVRFFFTPGMTVDTSPRQARHSPWANRHYLTGGIRTAKAREDRALTTRMYVEFPFRIALFTMIWVVFRPWDDRQKNWRPWRLFSKLERDRPLITDGR